VDDDEVRTRGGDTVAGVRSPGTGWRDGTRAIATVEPRAVSVHVVAPEGSPRNAWPATVTALAPAGPLTRVTAQLRDGQRVDADVTSRSVVELGLAPVMRVVLAVKAAQVTLYARQSVYGTRATVHRTSRRSASLARPDGSASKAAIASSTYFSSVARARRIPSEARSNSRASSTSAPSVSGRDSRSRSRPGSVEPASSA